MFSFKDYLSKTYETDDELRARVQRDVYVKAINIDEENQKTFLELSHNDEEEEGTYILSNFWSNIHLKKTGDIYEVLLVLGKDPMLDQDYLLIKPKY